MKSVFRRRSGFSASTDLVAAGGVPPAPQGPVAEPGALGEGKPSPWRAAKRAARAFLTTVVAVPLIVVMALVTSVATYVFLPLPVSLPAERPTPENRASTVYATDGTPIGQFRGAEQQVSIPAADIPDTIRRAVLAVEDHRFFEHRGVDWRAISRALVADVRERRIVQGGSTITQQLVKALYTGNERSWARKVKEALLAIRVERTYPKEEILTRYLNSVYLGESTFGVEAASRSYFHKPARDLTLSEAALLAGVIPAPSLYSPRANPELAEERRLLVLSKLEQYGLATPEEITEARAARPVINPPPKPESRYPYFMDYLRVYLLHVKGYPPDLVYRGGLRIETTLDPRLQAAGDAAVARLDRPKDPEAALVSLEPQTGFVRALVGGRNWDASQVNLALGRMGGGTGRQAGSAFKTFVLAAAFEAGIGPDKRYRAPSAVKPRGFDKPVRNYGGASYGSADLRTATWKSINTVFVQLIVDVGIKETAEMAKRLGISGIDLNEKLYGVMAIGTHETSALEMSSAYGIFANRGLRVAPTPVVSITKPDGEKLEDNRNPKRERVLEEPVADHVTAVLEGVVPKGTGRRADIGRPVAGKTGTSQNWENAWFVGYTPTLSTAVWMGHPGANIAMHGVHGVPNVSGGTLPAMIWHDYMAEALKDVPPAAFAEPGPLTTVAKREARERRLANKRLDEREGIDIPQVRSRWMMAPEGPWWTSLPLPEAHAPPSEGPPATTESPSRTRTRPPPSESSSSTSSSTTTTTRPPPRSSPLPLLPLFRR